MCCVHAGNGTRFKPVASRQAQSSCTAAWQVRNDSCSGSPEHRHGGTTLSPRERKIVRLVAEGCSNQQIATRLKLRPQTVKNQLSIIYSKLRLKRRSQLVLYAVRHEMV